MDYSPPPPPPVKMFLNLHLCIESENRMRTKSETYYIRFRQIRPRSRRVCHTLMWLVDTARHRWRHTGSCARLCIRFLEKIYKNSKINSSFIFCAFKVHSLIENTESSQKIFWRRLHINLQCIPFLFKS